MSRKAMELEMDRDPLWYKDAILYEVHVRAFYDSDGNGMGDFAGLTEKLDYLQDLGVTTIWLLPFYPSPLKDDGYDIADYTAVNPSYGNLDDVRNFVKEAHQRGLRVVTELVCNHTSDQHPWFQRARRSPPGSPERDFYVWSDTLEKYKDARIIFKDFETSNWAWDSVANAYYWHRFYSHQPDLNFDNPAVHQAIFDAMDFWMDMGIDGMRLDAIPYLYEREGTVCENLPETYAFLRDLRRHVDNRYAARMLLAEANQWPEDAAAYFGNGDQCHMAFHFPLMPRLFMAIRMEDRFPIIEILRQTPEVPPACQWALFLRNHDELTLEMVTDEERDYMYRTYAQDRQARINLGIRRRLAPLLGNNRRKIELMNGLLFSLPGTPVLYYGDEIGMGDNIYLGDRNGVRTPMQWSADRNAGFSRSNPQRLYLPIIIDPEYHYEAINVEAQQQNPHSLLWWCKRLIALRKRYKAFGRGTLQFVQPENHKVLSFIRHWDSEQILVVANLSRFTQYVELDLSAYKGLLPVEMFGNIEFPAITDRPYFLTLGPHSFYWFSLETAHLQSDLRAAEAPPEELPTVVVRESWTEVLPGQGPGGQPIGLSSGLSRALSVYLRSRRWFAGKGQRIKLAEIVEAIPIAHAGSAGPEAPEDSAYMTLLRVEYSAGTVETYVLPMEFVPSEPPQGAEAQRRIIARVRSEKRGQTGYLRDPITERSFQLALYALFTGNGRLRGEEGELRGSTTFALRQILQVEDEAAAATVPLEPALLRVEQSNTSVAYADRLILKLFRRVEPGINPELEIGRFLTERGTFPHTPRVAGAIEYNARPQGQAVPAEPMTLAIVEEFVHSETDGWRFTLDALSHFFDRVLATRPVQEGEQVPVPQPVSLRTLLDLGDKDPPALARETLSTYLEWARLLGQRTAELHLALSDASGDASFVPEPFTPFYQRSIYQSMRALTSQTLQLLSRNLRSLPDDVRLSAEKLLQREPDIFKRFHALLDRRISTFRTRYHGDYHLGQVLYTGKDLLIIDFEGEPARPLPERRIMRSPLRDVASMLRSFHYASSVGVMGRVTGLNVRPEDAAASVAWAGFWRLWASSSFLRRYLMLCDKAPFLPAAREDQEVLLKSYLLEKAIYELGYELNSRPAWVRIPLEGILDLLNEPSAT